jgi:hypothetical protein
MHDNTDSVMPPYPAPGLVLLRREVMGSDFIPAGAFRAPKFRGRAAPGKPRAASRRPSNFTANRAFAPSQPGGPREHLDHDTARLLPDKGNFCFAKSNPAVIISSVGADSTRRVAIRSQ